MSPSTEQDRDVKTIHDLKDRCEKVSQNIFCVLARNKQLCTQISSPKKILKKHHLERVIIR